MGFGFFSDIVEFIVMEFSLISTIRMVIVVAGVSMTWMSRKITADTMIFSKIRKMRSSVRCLCCIVPQE